MSQKAFLINDFVVNDWEGLTQDNALIASALRGGVGLPGARATTAQKYGKWPSVSGYGRPGKTLTLITHLLNVTAANRYTARRDLLAELNPERETAARLTVADQVAPRGLIAAFGPWDIYQDDSAAWHCRNLLWSDKDTTTIEGDITGGTTIVDGRESRQRAFILDAAATNRVVNPSFETNTTSWTNSGLASMTRVSTWYKFGYYSLQCLANSQFDQAYIDVAGFGAAATVTTTAWVRTTSSDVRLRVLSRPGGVTSGIANATGTGDWEKLTVTITLDAGETVARVQLQDARASGYDNFWVDGVQCEESDFPTATFDGSSGPGFAWSGAEHASTSARTASQFNLDDHADDLQDQDQLSIRLVVQAPVDADGEFQSATAYLFDIYDATTTDRIYIVYNEGANTWNVYIQGAVRLASAAQTFSASDWIEIVVTLDFDADSYKLYLDGALSDTDTTALSTPTALTEWNVGTNRTAGNHSGFAFAEVDVYDRVLTVAEAVAMYNNGSTHGRARYAEVLCEAAQPLAIGGNVTDRGLVSTLRMDGDVRWRSNDGDLYFMRSYDDAWTNVVPVDSDDEVHPVIRITPTDTKGSGFTYRRFIPVEWKVANSVTNYPILIGPVDTTGWVAAKMQADGDDLRVYVNGVEVDRWFGGASGAAGGPNSATTKVWINLDFSATQEDTLTTAIANAATVSEIECDTDISGYPSEGLLIIESETFYYETKNNTTRKFLDITRAPKGEANAGHAAGVTVRWLQHDAWLMYGDATLTAPTVDANRKPLFSLGASTNDIWDYDVADGNFGSDAGTRSGSWTYTSDDETKVVKYTANQDTSADPWEEIGLATNLDVQEGVVVGRFYLYHPCGISSADFQSGEKWTNNVAQAFSGQVSSSENGVAWTSEYEIPDPAASSNWEAWNQDIDPLAGTLPKYVGLRINAYTFFTQRVECADVEVGLNTTYTPDTAIFAELNNYQLSLTLQNSTTGESIELAFQMVEDEILEVDTYNKTIKYLLDSSRQLAALTIPEGPRRDWFRLIKGDNTIVATDTGMTALEIDFAWQRRDKE